MAATEFWVYIVSAWKPFEGEMRINFILLKFVLNWLDYVPHGVVLHFAHNTQDLMGEKELIN